MSATQVLVAETSTIAIQAAAPAETEVVAEALHAKVQQIRSQQLSSLLARQDELIERLNSLADVENVAMAERQRAIIQTDLESVRHQIVIRQENVGVLAGELFALYDQLGLRAQRANVDSSEDTAKRARAAKELGDAEQALIDARVAVLAAETAVTATEQGFWPFGKADRVSAAQANLETARLNVTTAEQAVETARDGVAAAEVQIEIDKAERIRTASLSESFALIRQFTEQATRVLKEDISLTEERRGITEKALNSAVTKKAETARALDTVRDELAKLQRDIAREQAALSEIPDHGSAAYADQSKIVVELEQKLTAKTGEELKLNTLHISLTAAIEANRSSLAGLTVQRDTSEVYVIKLETAEKTAAVLGHNIDRMIKNTMQQTAADALDRVSDSMTEAAISLGIEAEVASARARNDALRRHEELMRRLRGLRGVGDQAMAAEAARYADLDARTRAGYKEMGIDLDMGHLAAAAEAFAAKKEPMQQPADAGALSREVIY
jgi:hypothetical protein